MNSAYIAFLVIFIAFLAGFAWIDTRNGMNRAFQILLRIAVPMLMAGLIVFIVSFLAREKLVHYIIAAIGFVIFFRR